MTMIEILIPAHRNTFDDNDRNTDSRPQMRGTEDAAHDTSCLWRTWANLMLIGNNSEGLRTFVYEY